MNITLWLFGAIIVAVLLAIIIAGFKSFNDALDNDEYVGEANVPILKREPSTIERFRDIAKKRNT